MRRDARGAAEAPLGQLTTHVLNTADGVPAAGMKLRLMNGGRTVIREATTDADGRCDAPLLSGDDFFAGRYILSFAVGGYYRARGVETGELAFLEDVEIAFGVADASQHYHVPLLVSPYSYSTYRGS